jgi:hypothetical protein
VGYRECVANVWPETSRSSAREAEKEAAGVSEKVERCVRLILRQLLDGFLFQNPDIALLLATAPA